jgi:hypothetical protein
MKRLLIMGITLASTVLGIAGQANAVTAHVVTFFENPFVAPNVAAYEPSAVPAPLTSFLLLVPAFTNPVYVFSKWNKKKNGSGTTYLNGANYSFSNDLTLYAQWTPALRTVAFCQNRSITDRTCALETRNASSSLTLFANLSPLLSNPGYSFSSWNTKANGSGVRYANGQSFSFASDLTLYAQWAKSAAALNFVGSVQNSQSVAQLNSIANVILHRHFHQVQVVQFQNQDGASIIGLLTKILVRHDGPGITVALKRTNSISYSTGVEVFAN